MTTEKQKEYNREMMRRWRMKNPNYQNEWNKANFERAQEIWTKSYWKNREEHLKNTSLWSKNNRHKINKRRNTPYGKLVSHVESFTSNNFEKDKVCGICKTTDNLEFHHWRYRKPVQRQDFSTLCKDCHKVQHGGTKLKMIEVIA